MTDDQEAAVLRVLAAARKVARRVERQTVLFTSWEPLQEVRAAVLALDEAEAARPPGLTRASSFVWRERVEGTQTEAPTLPDEPPPGGETAQTGALSSGGEAPQESDPPSAET